MAKLKKNKKPAKVIAKKKMVVKGKAKINPKADLNKDSKISKYEGKRAAAIEKGKKKALKESVDIANFIYALSTKNYAQANKYLVQAVESKISNRIDQAINTPLF